MSTVILLSSLPGNPEMLLRFAGRKSKQHFWVPKWEKCPTGMGMHVEREEQEINVSGIPARQPGNVA
jgi:hypothetical protein